MNYFYAITISPGFIDKSPPPPLDYGKKSMVVHGASSWSEKGINITPASLNECQKCKKVRPEVSLLIIFFFTSSSEIKVTVIYKILESSSLSPVQ